MTVLSFGELLFDIIEDTPHIGGAPFNFAAHMTKLGFETHLLSAVGSDDLGREAFARLRSLEMNEDFINESIDLPTGTVSVSLSKGEPEYTIREDTAWDAIRVDDYPALNYRLWDLFYFGTLAQRSEANRTALYSLLDDIVTARHIFLDVNLRQRFYTPEILEESLKRATISKMNEDEASIIKNMLEGEGSDSREIAAWAAEQYSLETVIITRGGANSILIHSSDGDTEVPVQKVEVADTVGAGDAFSAGFCFGLLQGLSPDRAGELGAKLGSFTASRRGAVPEYSEEIISSFLQLEDEER